MNNNFRRSNVNAKTLQITDPGRSSFNLGHKNELSIPFGKVVPVSHRILLPSDTFQGSIKPNFHLEKIATPSIGPTRLDTHTFVVNFRRINNQMRNNLENGKNFFPSFSILDYLIMPFTLLPTRGFAKPREFLGSLFKTNSNFRELIQNFWYFINFSYEYCIPLIKDVPYYQQDTLINLSNYYKRCRKDLDSYLTNVESASILDFYKFCIIPFYKPWCGESSLFDYLGYPIITLYNPIIHRIQSDFPDSTSLLEYSSKVFAELKSQANAGNYSRVNQVSLLLGYYKLETTPPPGSLVYNPYTIKMTLSELPLRAYYAVWYDYLRNWHIEERKNILDPDNFNNGLVLRLSSDLTDATAIVNQFASNVSFCMLRSRDYNSDFLTTIQTDDDFRHVYSPVFSNVSDSQPTVESSSTNITPSDINGIYLPDYANGKAIYFPSDKLGYNTTDESTILAQDLQTMRRAGMLEKWLARNYYFPDTYVGRLQARFGVRPSDYEVLVSNYLGGSESFITGTELVANMSTTESVVGSRNLKAEMSTQDYFSGTVSDYSYLISVVSTVPIVSYDVLHPSVRTIDYVDFPQPEFATDTRVEASVSDFLRGFEIKPFIGYVPRYYMFRTSADETHGRYLTDYRTFNWFRDAFSMSQQNFEFSLNPYSLRVNLPLDAFIGLNPWDDFAYGDCDCQLVVNRALPAAIEVI